MIKPIPKIPPSEHLSDTREDAIITSPEPTTFQESILAGNYKLKPCTQETMNKGTSKYSERRLEEKVVGGISMGSFVGILDMIGDARRYSTVTELGDCDWDSN